MNRPLDTLYTIDEQSGCWNWCGTIEVNGYGVIKIDGKTVKAHRLMYERVHGAINPELELHHRCENKRCINPEHLDPLTPLQHASKHRRLLLTDEDVCEIVSLRGVVSQKSLASRFGVGQSTISRIQKRAA